MYDWRIKVKKKINFTSYLNSESDSKTKTKKRNCDEGKK